MVNFEDHEAVFVESSLRPTKKSPSLRRVYKYHQADYEGFKKEFREFARDINEQATEMDSQTIWTSFKTTIHRLMEKYIPHKTVRGDKKPKPWITRTIWALHHKRNKLFKKQRATRKSRDIDKYKKMKSKIQRAERQAYWQHVEEVLDPGDPDIDDRPGKQKRFWSFIKSLKRITVGLHHSRTEARCTQTRWTKPTYLTTSMNPSTQEKTRETFHVLKVNLTHPCLTSR